jgi:outer membrane protein OmpA-like peptidoglycan-associated protein
MRGLLATLALLSVLVGTSPAQADETWLLTGEANLGMAVSGWQSKDFAPGGSLSVGGYRSLAPFLLVGAKARGGLLLDGEDPGAGRADLGPGTWWLVGGALRLRPYFDRTKAERGTGLFVEGVPGVVLTGDLTRFGFEVGVGYGFAVDSLDVGPVVRYTQILEGRSGLDDRDARIVLLGVELALFDARAKKAPPPVVQSDRDGDGIFDVDDDCATVPEDKDNFEDDDGCPEPDNDRDGVLDAADGCPNDPEDIDGFEDLDGCPDADNDKDGLLDAVDQCPNDAETVNGIEDEDGCPDKGLIELKDNRIVLEETVLFDFEKARVKSSARPILDAIVKLWKQHARDWTRVRIEGHADARGDAAFNTEISDRRARQVLKSLEDAGIPAAVMEAEGFGSSKLRDRGMTEQAHQRNRRVEFVVITETKGGTP